MKPLIDVHDPEELHRLICLLEGAGIPTFHRRHGGRGDSYDVLFVRIDAQHEDALRLLANPLHVVSNPVDPAEVAALEAVEEAFPVPRLDRVLGLLVSILGVVLLLYLLGAILLTP